MAFKQLTPTLAVSPQLSEADVAEAAKEGFRAIIDNRPDGEEGGQISAAEIEKLASDQGMAFAHIPVLSGNVDDQSVDRMADALASLDGPVLAYCRTGTRSATLWALTQSGSADPDAILRIARDAGYDLTQIKPRLKPPAV